MPQQEQKLPDSEPPQGDFSSLYLPPVKKAFSLSSRFMTLEDVKQFVELQEIVRPTLKKPYHLKYRDEMDIYQHLDERMSGVIVMALRGPDDDEGFLVGGALLFNQGNEQALKNTKEYGTCDTTQAATTVIGTVCVHPEYKGQGIGREILGTAYYAAAMRNMSQMIAGIADDNDDSQSLFENAGFICRKSKVVSKATIGGTIYQYTKDIYSYPIHCSAASPALAL